MMKILLPAIILLGLIASSVAQGQSAPLGPKDFAIMAWGSSPSSPDQLREMKEAGLNISGFCDVKDLDKVRAAGLSCFVSDPWIGAHNPPNVHSDSEIRQHFAQLKTEIGDNPAAIGVFLRDEPNATQMQGLGRLSAGLRAEMPEKWPYVNLLPYMVSPQRLQTDTYDSYVKLLVTTIRQPFLSYDNYSLVHGQMLDTFFTNLEIVRRLSLETHTQFWNIILAVAHFNYMVPSDATFRLQAYSTMAYGGRGIQYFTYFAPKIGNYRHAAVDQFGDRTATWDMMRRINHQIRELAPTLVRLHSTGVYHFPDVPAQGKPLADSTLIQSVDMTQQHVVTPVVGRFLIGEFKDDQGRPYFMIVNKDLNNSFQFQIHLKDSSKKLIHVSPYTGQEEPFGREMEWLAPGAGSLFRVE